MYWDPMKDNTSATDYVEAGLSTEVVPPDFPCPRCGKEMGDNRTYEQRMAGMVVKICSVRACNTEADWTSGTPVVMGAAAAPN